MSQESNEGLIDLNQNSAAVRLMCLADALLFLAAGWFAWQGRLGLSLSVLGATALLVLWQVTLCYILRSTKQTVGIESGIRHHHYVQAMLHICIYSYWGLYWDEVGKYVPLLIVQVFFAYGFEMLLSWSRYRVWRIGFGPLPIVFSINLFLWFAESWYFFQFVLLMLTYVGRECVRWNRDGRNTHIVNPSALSLTVVGLAVVFTGTADTITRAVDIVAAFDLPPNFIEVLFFLSLVVQFLFGTALVTMGAILALALLFQVSMMTLGAPIADVVICAPVFLGLTFLVTDPSTSPKSNLGKFLFGAGYGVGAFLVCVSLRLTHHAAFVDKILAVPLVNLLAPTFDRVAAAIQRRTEQISWIPVVKAGHNTIVLVCLGIFLGILPFLKTPILEDRADFIPPSVGRTSPSVTKLWNNMEYSRLVLPEPYRPFGFRSEIASYRRIRSLYEDGQSRNAIEDLSDTIRRNPDYIPAYYARGVAHRTNGDLDSAIADFTETIRMGPDIAMAYNERGIVYAMKGEFDKAIDQFTEVIERKPDFGEAYDNRGYAYLQTGDQASADSDFAKARSLGFSRQ